ncbi:MAG: hypothetical protein Q4D82_02010 [Neisseria sp.]|nr:hypothetical protein [Neisseria sp.]
MKKFATAALAASAMLLAGQASATNWVIFDTGSSGTVWYDSDNVSYGTVTIAGKKHRYVETYIFVRNSSPKYHQALKKNYDEAMDKLAVTCGSPTYLQGITTEQSLKGKLVAKINQGNNSPFREIDSNTIAATLAKTLC